MRSRDEPPGSDGAALGLYTLDAQNQPVAATSILAWARWIAQAQIDGERTVANDVVAERLCVSTVFLGLDHSFGGGPPLLWETMIFNLGEPIPGGDQDYQSRYSSRVAAEKGHKRAVSVAKRLIQEYEARTAHRQADGDTPA